MSDFGGDMFNFQNDNQFTFYEASQEFFPPTPDYLTPNQDYNEDDTLFKELFEGITAPTDGADGYDVQVPGDFPAAQYQLPDMSFASESDVPAIAAGQQANTQVHDASDVNASAEQLLNEVDYSSDASVNANNDANAYSDSSAFDDSNANNDKLNIDDLAKQFFGDVKAVSSQTPSSSESNASAAMLNAFALPAAPPPTFNKRKSKSKQPVTQPQFNVNDTFNIPAFSSPPRSTKPTKDASTAPEPGANGLRFTSFAEAQAFAFRRTSVHIDNDDWAIMEVNPAPYIHHIMAAFSAELAPCPSGYDMSPDKVQEWADYQGRNITSVSKIITQNPCQLELAAWFIFDTVIDAHKNGLKNGKTTTMKCSAHLEDLLQPIRDYAVFRHDIIRLQRDRVEDLAENKQSAITRKMCNYKGNGRKTNRDAENAKRAAEQGVEYTAVLGNKGGNKRKRGCAEGDEGAAVKKVKKGKKDAGVVAAVESELVAPPSSPVGDLPDAAAVGGAQSDEFLGVVDAALVETAAGMQRNASDIITVE